MSTLDPYKLKLIFTDATHPIATGSEKRWMDEGDIVSFTNPKERFGNAEFEINSQKFWLIWFSQLYTPLYNGDLNNPQVCSIKIKDGILYAPMNLTFPKFWNMVRGKRFKVHVDSTPCFCVNKSSQKVQILPFNETEKIYKYVHDKLMEGKIDEVRGMLKPTRCYDFEEI